MINLQGMISIKTLSKLAQLRHEGVMLVRNPSPYKPALQLSPSSPQLITPPSAAAFSKSRTSAPGNTFKLLLPRSCKPAHSLACSLLAHLRAYLRPYSSVFCSNYTCSRD